MWGSKPKRSEPVALQAAGVAPSMSAEESKQTLKQVRMEGMEATNLKKLAESLNTTSDDVMKRLNGIAESLRGAKQKPTPKAAAATGGFYGPLAQATSNLVSACELIDEIEIVLGIREGSRGVPVPGAKNLNG